MAIETTKTYSVTVTFRYSQYDAGTSTNKTITASDLHVAELREEIIERIEKACRLTKGTLNSQPGSVSET